MSDEATAKKKTKAGWYPHPNLEGMERLWNGEQWTDEVRLGSPDASRQTTATGMIWMGIFVGIVAGAVGGSVWSQEGGESAGLVVLIIGGAIAQIVLLIGIIAKGIEIGNRASR